LAKANERRIGEANRLPLGNKKATLKGGFFIGNRGRTHEENEFDMEDIK
jgi:hypothetical protein